MTQRPSTRTLLWMIGLAFVLHEAEEWNLVAWLATNFEPDPAFDDRQARTLLALFAFLGISFTGLCLRLLNPRAALLSLLPLFVGVILGNALTHIVWSVTFRGYAPGLVTSALLLVPLISWLLGRVLRERMVPIAFLLPWLLLAILQPMGAVYAGATLSGPQLALQSLGARLGDLLWASP